MIKYILFDLDATLLPFHQDEFVKTYLELLAEKMTKYGYEKQKLMASIWSATKAMQTNSGEKTNEQVFWDTYTSIYGENAKKDEPIFDKFYRNEFNKVKDLCVYENAKIPEMIKKLKQKGFTLAIATNPVFPKIATKQRILWADLNIDDFEFFTTFEDHCFCKPNTNYYVEVLNRLGTKPDECLMVGNDVDEDMVAEEIGIKVFLLTDFLLNRHNKDCSCYPQGNVDDLLEFIENLNK